MNEIEHDAGEGGTGAPPDEHERNRAPDLTREYRSDELTVRWYAKRCIHSAECVRLAPRVFNPMRRPWVDLTRADTERIMAAVEACPTGALEYVVPGREEESPAEVQVRAVADGPFFLRGRITIRDHQGQVIRRAHRVALCRCGLSRNKPFCDNSHRSGETT